MSQEEKPHRVSVIREEEVQQSERERAEDKQQIQLQQIMHEINPQQHPPPQVQPRITHLEPLVVKNPIYYYKGQEKYDWRLEELEPIAILEHFQLEPTQYSQELPFENDIQVSFLETVEINKHIGYSVKKVDKNGQLTFTRRYTEYMSFRKKLAELWPAVFIPTLPNKTLIGSTDEETIRSRVKYILHFWRKLTCFEEVYYSQEVRLFMDQKVDIQATFSSIQTSNISELLEKYKTAFPQAQQTRHQEQFMYKKDQAPLLFQQFEQYFSSKKIELSEFKDSFYKLADLKTKYVKALSKLNQVLLPSYENTLFNWFNGTPIQEKPSRKSQDTQKTSPERKKSLAESEPQKQNQSEPQTKEQSQQPKKQEQKEPNNLLFPNPLYNSQAYKAKLDDTATLIKDYNSSIWIIYDVIKFQLKDIDCVLSALEDVRSIQKQIDFLKRGIAGNNEQIQALNNKKLTLKTFFMGGSQDDKKNKLTAEIQLFQEKLQKTEQFYHLLLALVQQQLVAYHKQRIDYYTKAVKNSAYEQLSVARAVAEFHIYQYQLFAKERARTISQLTQEKSSLQIKPEEEEVK